MHDDRTIVEARLGRVVAQRIGPARWGARVPLRVEAWEAPGEPVSADEAAAQEYSPFAVGSPFGRPWGTTWFRMDGEVPAEWAGAHVSAIVDLGFGASPGFQAEGLLWEAGPDGRWRPVRGLHPLNHEIVVAASAAGGEQVRLVVEAASNPEIANDRPDPNSDLPTAGTTPIYHLARAELAVVHTEVVALRHDIRVLNALMEQLGMDDPRRHEILRALEAMLDRVDLGDVVGSAPAARAELVDVLDRPAHASAHRISAIGHAHIDTAWLWPLRETVRKCARTFSGVLELMGRYPELRFGCSQAAQYRWMEERYPSVFEAIRERVADGRWVPIGGMWVEADTNLAGGEALIRQITHGQRYFEDTFGVTCTEVWIPDVFGYPGSLPGIMKACGIDRFLTQKLSWNQTNRFPHHTFWWEGIDGSTVFTHFPPVETYNANFSGFELARAVRTFTDKGRATRSLMPFGFGDGGGGPTEQMMEAYRRVRDLEGSPRVEIESPEAFFDAAIAEYPDAPRWVGELYFEMHRGTFTSQAKTKAGNRRCELLLREAELWCTAAATRAGAAYPADDLDRLWKEVLLLQFHDILPGSSIGWVHREAEATYERVAAELTAIIDAALATAAPSAGTAVANPAPFAVDGVVTLPEDAVDPSGDAQSLTGGGVAAWVRLEPGAVAPVSAAARPLGDHAPVTVTDRTLDNGIVRVELDDDGLVASFVDVASGRDAIAPGRRGNLLQLHQDLPNVYDAWDIEDFYRRRVVDLVDVASIEVLDAGPLVGRVRIRRVFGASAVTQTLELRAGSRRLDVHNEVDWHHHEQMLKVSFPVDVHATEVTREIQFGHLRTPVHTNTSWDAARFEVCAHRWVDVSEHGFGVALLNDSKYGHDVTRSAPDGGDRPVTDVRLTLLRGARFPDPEADQGHHAFTYALMAHGGDLRSGGVIEEGYRLNCPVRAVAAGSGAEDAPAPVVASSNPAVVVEAAKLADDGSDDVVVRCYEAWGGRATTTLTFGFDAASAARVDARERPLPHDEGALSLDGRSAALSLCPFEIVTVRLARGHRDRGTG